jgi:hypothetical protein
MGPLFRKRTPLEDFQEHIMVSQESTQMKLDSTQRFKKTSKINHEELGGLWDRVSR